MVASKLSRLQQDVLAAFFRREKRFFLKIFPEKPMVGEILANKLCTLLSRAEIRDLVDARELERAGYRIEDALAHAQRKDAGLTPAQLGWVLSQIAIGDDANPPGGVSSAELRGYLDDLVARLARHAFPGSSEKR